MTGTAGIAAVGALVLAGARASGDPLCQSEGVASKAEIDIAGRPMLARVMAALAESGVRMPVWLVGLTAAQAERTSGGVPFTPLPSGGTGPASALVAAMEGGVSLPLVVTTCDHALLTPAMVQAFVQGSVASGADLTVGLAERRVIEAAYPETRRTYLRLGRAELSGCNLFYLATPAALTVLRFWVRAEEDRKRPWRIALRFGLGTALRLALLRPDPGAAFALLSRRLGARVSPVILPFAEAAIDVDKPGDLALVRDIFARRAA